MIAHSLYRPSNAARRLVCPGSMLAEADRPDEWPGESALLGTAGHDIAAHFLQLGKPLPLEEPPAWLFDYRTRVDYGDPRKQSTKTVNVPLTLNVLQGVQMYVQRMLGYGVLGAGSYVEKKVYLPLSGHKTKQNVFGTADFIAFHIEQRWLVVADLKTGQGIVDVRDNPQLIFYALGALNMIGTDEVDTVQIEIVQPLAPHSQGPIRSVTYSREFLMSHWHPKLLANAKECFKPNATRKASEHCKWCKCASDCTVLHAQRFNKALIEFEPTIAGIEQAKLDKIGEVLTKKKQVIALIKACEDEAIRLWVDEGVKVPGVKIIRGRAHRKWKDPARAEHYLLSSRRLAQEKVFNRELKSPAQMQSSTGLDSATIAQMCYSPRGSYLAVRETDRGETVSPKPVAEFKDVVTVDPNKGW